MVVKEDILKAAKAMNRILFARKMMTNVMQACHMIFLKWNVLMILLMVRRKNGTC